MSILLKVSNTSDQVINFEVIESRQLETSELMEIFNTYFTSDELDSNFKILKVIYPNHTEIYTHYNINYYNRR